MSELYFTMLFLNEPSLIMPDCSMLCSIRVVVYHRISMPVWHALLRPLIFSDHAGGDTCPLQEVIHAGGDIAER